jgi:hypothetical protein
MSKPEGRTKDLISSKHKNSPHVLDRCDFTGCDTIWKCFKRSVWRFPNKNFLGEREKIYSGGLNKYKVPTGDVKYGEYVWQTFRETDDIVEAFSRSVIKRNLCPVVKSDVEGTPDLKFMGIFSENRI